MAHENQDDGLIRRYLLGRLVEDEREQLEEKMMADNEVFNRVLLAEDEMVEEYVHGELSESDRAGFEASFLSTPEGRKQVTYARALSEYVKDPSPSSKVRVRIGEERVAEELTAPRPSAEGPGAQGPSKESKASRQAWWPRQELVPYLRLAVAAVVVLSVGLGIWRLFFYQSEVSKGTAALAYAYRDQRPLEARISGFNYARVSTTRGGDENVDRVALNRASGILHDAEFEHPGPASHYALGRLYLAEKKFDDAIKQFEEALKGDPNNAQLHSDYGVALLEKGKPGLEDGESGKSLEELASALEQVNRALELDGSLLEPLFNRALLYQEMILPQQAEEGWRKYLEQDSSSPWADEARKNLRLVEEQRNKASESKEQLLQDFLAAYEARSYESAWKAFSQSRARTGSFIVEKLLDDYLNLSTKGEIKRAREKLQLLSYAGELEVQTAGDHFTSDTVRFYKLTTPGQQVVLARARQLVRLGLENYDQAKLEDAIDYYTRAKGVFDRAGDISEGTYAKYLTGHCFLMQSKLKLSLSIFGGLARNCEGAQYRWLLAQTLYAVAMLHAGLNDYSISVETSNRFLEISKQIGDTNGMAKALQFLAQTYLLLNDYHKSLSLNQQSLALGSVNSSDPLQRWRDYFFVALSLNLLRFYTAAVVYQKEALRLAIQIGRPQVVCRSYINLGLMYGSLQDYGEATRCVQLAFQLGKGISSESAKAETLAYSSLQLGHLYRKAGDLTKAIVSYDQAIQSYSQLDYPAFSYVAHKGKLLSCIALGGCSSDEKELEVCLNLFEQYRSKILEESNRNSFFDTEQDMYDVAIDFEYSRNNNSRAFEYSEKSRARSLLDLSRSNTKVLATDDVRFTKVHDPLNLTQIMQRLPEQAQILQYAALDDRLIIWVISRTGITTRVQDIPLKELNDKINAYLSALYSSAESNEEQAAGAAKSLYSILVGPVEVLLDKNKQICVVADKNLNYLPFNALISSSSGKYLVEEYIFLFAPSSNMFIFSSESAGKKTRPAPEKLLSVGNPNFDRIAFPSLVDLPSARREAETIASFYNSSPPIVGEKATRKLIESEIEKHDVIHLALHSVTDEQFPMRSKLVLAKEPSGRALHRESEGVLQANEIYKLNLPLTRLVVLSACRTGVGRYYGGEGTVGISRSFIAAGVPLVIASLWPVDSDSTAELMISFHRHRKVENLSTVEALRRAELEMLKGDTPRYHLPYYWASFAAIGGYARF
jgi:CHAT domain-containing protein